MELTDLLKRIIESFKGPEEELAELLNLVEENRAVYPYNKYELLLSKMLEKN